MTRIAVSISHEDDYAVAIAYGIRSTGGRYVFPPDSRPADQIAHWQARDPLPAFEQYLQDRHILSAEQMADIGLSIDQDLADAVTFADNSPYPAPEEALDDVFAL